MLKHLGVAAAALLVAGYAAGATAAAPANPQIANDIFVCMAPALPKGWRRTWMVVKRTGASQNEQHMEAEFYYSTSEGDSEGIPLPGLACKRDDLVHKIFELNTYLPRERWGWNEVTVLYSADSKGNIQFKIRYDYPEQGKENGAAPQGK